MLPLRERRKMRWKEVFEAILVGACVAFFSAFLDGVSEALRGWGNNTLGGISTTLTVIARRLLS